MRLLLSKLFLVGFVTSSHACEAPMGWSELIAESSYEFQLFADVKNTDITIGKVFNLPIFVCSKTGVKIEGLNVDAQMPAHKHGMNYRPEVKMSETSEYEASGMLFHMPGVWRLEITADVNGKAHYFHTDIMAK